MSCAPNLHLGNAGQRFYFDVMPILKALTSAANVIKLLKTKSCEGYKLHHAPNNQKTFHHKTI